MYTHHTNCAVCIHIYIYMYTCTVVHCCMEHMIQSGTKRIGIAASLSVGSASWLPKFGLTSCSVGLDLIVIIPSRGIIIVNNNSKPKIIIIIIIMIIIVNPKINLNKG